MRSTTIAAMVPDPSLDDAAHGFDALCVNSFVSASELEAKVRDALTVAAKAG